MKTDGLTKIDYKAVVEERRKQRRLREHLATDLWSSLAAQYRIVRGIPVDGPIAPADQALLRAAVSASLEIQVTTDRLISGSAQDKSLRNLVLARSELRRCFRALNLIADSGEGAAPLPGVTIEDLKAEYAAKEAATA